MVTIGRGEQDGATLDGETMSPESAVYLYGVVRDGDPLVLDVPPISGGPVYTLSHRGLGGGAERRPAAGLRGDAQERPRAPGGDRRRDRHQLGGPPGWVRSSPQWVVANFLEERFDRVAEQLLDLIAATWRLR